MRVKVLHDLKGLKSAKEIYQKLLTERGLDPHPPKPGLSGLIKDLKLSRADLAAAKTLITKHLDEGNDILVYGDYDADGITATAIMWTALSAMSKDKSARVLPFIPDRTRHGYGLSPASLSDIFSGTAFAHSTYKNFAPKLVITVDNGIVANKEVGQLKRRGVDVIITDHHQPDTVLPPSDVILHSTVSSGAGLAWVIALFLSDSSPETYQLLDLATIGIVADLLPLTGVNRQLVTRGLKTLSQTQNIGLRALIETAQIEASPISTYHLNYQIAPRLNAAGRISDATDALRLLVTNNREQAGKLAKTISAHNQDRQDLTEKGIAHALQFPPEHNIIIAASANYHEGVIGLIAGKLAERWHRPAIAISLGKEVSKGSARSVNGIDITKLLRRFHKEFQSLGGHELAAGFSVQSGRIPKLTELLTTYADQEIDSSLLSPYHAVDGELTLSQTSPELVRLLDNLSPFGIGNPKPSFISRDLAVLEDRPLGKDGSHRRLTIESNSTTRQAIWFNCAIKHSIQEVKELVYTLDLNKWQGRETLQLVVKNANL